MGKTFVFAVRNLCFMVEKHTSRFFFLPFIPLFFDFFCGQSGDSYMLEKLLLKCDNSIYAHEITFGRLQQTFSVRNVERSLLGGKKN